MGVLFGFFLPIAGIAAAILCAAIVLSPIFLFRRFKYGHCASCHYSLRGLSNGTICPECGFSVRLARSAAG
jgi:hypothetical protein